MNAMTKPLSRTEKGSLVRPLYAPGLLLEDEDLTSAVSYTQNSLRLVLRSLFGCGVVCGLKLGAQFICQQRKVRISVAKGVALDCNGNPIELRQSIDLEYDPKCEEMPRRLWVTACYTAQDCMPTHLSCSEDDDEKVIQRRSLDAVEIRVSEQMPGCACSCARPDDREPQKDPRSCCGEHAEGRVSSDGSDASDGAAAAARSPQALEGESAVREKRPDRLAEACACYESHNKGECDCECGGTCVVLGYVTRVSEQGQDAEDWRAVYDARRFVRPMLLGSQQCYCYECVLSLRQRQPQYTEQPDLMESGGRPVEQGGAGLVELRARILEREERLASMQEQERRFETLRLVLDAEIDKRQQELTAARNDPNATEQARNELEKALLDSQNRQVELVGRQHAAVAQKEQLGREIEMTRKRAERESAYRRIGDLKTQLTYMDEEILRATSHQWDTRALDAKRKQLASALKKEVDGLL